MNDNLIFIAGEMDEFLKDVARIRKGAEESSFWNPAIDALIEANSEYFQGPILRSDFEASLHFVLDQYDAHSLIKNGLLKPDKYKKYLQHVQNRQDGNPFSSIIELTEERKVKKIEVWKTVDTESVWEFLSNKYMWAF